MRQIGLDKDSSFCYRAGQEETELSFNKSVTQITPKSDPHTLTILTHPQPLTKSYARDAQGNVIKTSYPRAKTFTTSDLVAQNIQSLENILMHLSKQPQSAVIRAAVRDGVNKARPFRRLLHDDKKIGDKATLEHADRAWVCADSDGLTLPFDVDPNDPQHLDNAARYLLTEHGLDGVSAVVAWSSSAFLGESAEIAPRKAKAHLWFLLDKPVCSESLEPWLVSKGFDGATARPVQVHYTANPVFTGGLRDPLAWRVKLFQGSRDSYPTEHTDLYDADEAKRRSESEEAKRKELQADLRKARDEAKKFARELELTELIDDCRDRKTAAVRLVDRALEEIRYSSQGTRHATIYGQSFWIGRLVGGCNGLNEHQVKSALLEASTSLLSGEGRAEEAERTALDGFEEGTRTPITLEPSAKTKKQRKQKRKGQAKLQKKAESLLARYTRLSEQALCDLGLDKKERQKWLPSIMKQDGMDAILASLGTGKTEQAKALCKEYGRVLWLAHRRALTRNTSERLGEGFVLYLDQEGELACERLILCVDSIARAVLTVDLVVIDEADQVLQSLIKRPQKGKHSDAILQRIQYLSTHLKEARQVVLLSADLDRWTVEAFARMADFDPAKVRHVKHEYTDPSASWRFFEKGTEWKAAVRRAWMGEERLAIFCASREQVKTLAEWMQNLRPTAKIISVHAEAEDEDRNTLLHVADSWGQADAVLYTTSAGSGVSFDKPDYFDRVCVWGTNAPRGFMASEYTQGSERIRNPKSREVLAYICEGGRAPLTREEIRGMERNKEKSTVSNLQKHAPLEINEGKIGRSRVDTLAIFVWLHAKAQREERSAHPLKWILQTLLSRGIKIIHDQGEPSKKDAKALREEISEAKETQREREIEEIVTSADLGIEDADKLRQNEVSKAEQMALKKHDVARFYLDTRDEMTSSGLTKSAPPPQPSKDLVVKDKRGRTRKQIGKLLDALLWREEPAYFIHLDRLDLIEDPDPELDTDIPQGIARKVRSVVDARHHALRAELSSDMLDVICGYHPELHEYLFGGCRHTEPEKQTSPPHYQTALKKLFSHAPERLSMMRVRGLSPLSGPEKIVGDLCQHFGIKRESEQVRNENGRVRNYSINFGELDALLDLAKVERGKRERRIEKWREQESLAAVGGDTVTHKKQEEIKQHIAFDCDTPSTPNPSPVAQLHELAPQTTISNPIPPPSPLAYHQPIKRTSSIVPYLRGPAFHRAGITEQDPFEVKVKALFKAEGGPDFARAIKKGTSEGEDTSRWIEAVDNAARRVCESLGGPAEEVAAILLETMQALT